MRATSASRHASQSAQSGRGRITTPRFSSPGLWKRFMSGWLSAFSVGMVNDTDPSGQSRHKPAMAKGCQSGRPIFHRTGLPLS